jgi:hypothetical protein
VHRIGQTPSSVKVAARSVPQGPHHLGRRGSGSQTVSCFGICTDAQTRAGDCVQSSSRTRNLNAGVLRKVGVCNYVPGKADWSASGLPTEGTLASVPTVGDAARRNVPSCALEEKVSDARDRVRAAGWDACLVVNEERVALGLLREKELALDPDVEVEQVMRNGPATSRPNEPVSKMAKQAYVGARDAYHLGDDLRGQAGRRAVPGRCRAPGRQAGRLKPWAELRVSLW